MSKQINLELFSCAGGMAEGFRRAGIEFDMAVDFAEDHCDSYEKNIGHRPIRMDVRDLLRLARLGWRVEIDLLVADPPCTPWSRAGKRLGTADDRDMLEVTCDLIGELRPHRYLIGNVPGLDDSINLPIVQRVIGGLSRFGYCTADFARLDAADYGVPQHRIRPFWFGHIDGPCIRWPKPTHCDPEALATASLFASERLASWVTCEQALGHLDQETLGRPVRMRNRNEGRSRHDAPVHTSAADSPARSITTQCRVPGHATTMVVRKKRPPSTKGPQSSRTIASDKAREDRVGSGSPVLEWPWKRAATTVQADPRLAPPGHHDDDYSIMSLPDAIILSELAATILQGFPESWVFSGGTKKARWSQIGQAMPPPLAAAVAVAVAEQERERAGAKDVA